MLGPRNLSVLHFFKKNQVLCLIDRTHINGNGSGGGSNPKNRDPGVPTLFAAQDPGP